jgi:hypothetical protein
MARMKITRNYDGGESGHGFWMGEKRRDYDGERVIRLILGFEKRRDKFLFFF